MVFTIIWPNYVSSLVKWLIFWKLRGMVANINNVETMISEQAAKMLLAGETTVGETTGRSARPWVAAALLLGLLTACASQDALQREPVRRLDWTQHLNGDDLREACFPGSLPRYRMVYNARHEEQLRRYEVISDGAGGAHVIARARAPVRVVTVAFDAAAPRDWRLARSRLGPAAFAGFETALKRSGFFDPPPVGLRLPSAAFYWVAVGCREGRIYFNAWRHPSDRYGALLFPDLLFALDETGVAVNPPRELDAALLTFERGSQGTDDGAAKGFWLTVGENGLRGF